jgi:hypothetical protein
MVNFEGGAIPEEYHTAYIIDRVNTTSTVWLGLTLGCCQCHDHKFDPFTQKDFYRLYAFFNNVPEQGLDGSKGNAVPFIKAPTPGQQRQLDDRQAVGVPLEEPRHGLEVGRYEVRHRQRVLVRGVPLPFGAVGRDAMQALRGGLRQGVRHPTGVRHRAAPPRARRHGGSGCRRS